MERPYELCYIIAHIGRYGDRDEATLYYHAGMRDGVYDTTYDVTKATRFKSRDEVFDFLRNHCYFHGAMVLEYSVGYLDYVKDNEALKERLRKPWLAYEKEDK